MDLYEYLVFSPSLVAIILATVLFLYHLIRRKPTNPSPSPPEAAGAWPIVGHLPLLQGPQPVYRALNKMAEKHGPIFTIRMGVHRALVVSSSEIARECFTTNDKAFLNRPKGIATASMTYKYAMFPMSPYGMYWRQTRKIAVVELLSNARLENLRPIWESEVHTLVKELHALRANHGKAGHAVKTDMKNWIGDLTLNIVFRMVMGKRYQEAMSTSSSDGDRCRRALREFFEYMGGFMVSDAIPWLRWLDLGGHEKAMKEIAILLDRLAERWLGDHKRSRASGEDKNNHDFMSAMLSILDTGGLENSGYDADTINKASSMSIVMAATDSTKVGMTWTLALLLNNREALKKAQQELDEQVGRERRVEQSDLKNLPYLQAIIKETLRLYPPGPLLVPRESIEDCTVAGFRVPAGTRLLVNLWNIHRNPKVWSDPHDFKPERFLTGEAKSFDVRGNNFDLMPFGSGRRMCPGTSFALQVSEFTLGSLIQSFDFTTPSDEPVDMTECAALTNLRANPLDVLLTPRLPAGVY